MRRFLPLVWSGFWRKPGARCFWLVQIMRAFLLSDLLPAQQIGAMSTTEHINPNLLAIHPRGSSGSSPAPDRRDAGVRLYLIISGAERYKVALTSLGCATVCEHNRHADTNNSKAEIRSG